MNIFLAVVLIVLIFSGAGLLVSVRPPRIHSGFHPDLTGLPYEAVSFRTDDGLTLRGWFIPRSGSDRVIVGLHGYPADKSDILPAILFLHSNFNLLVFDFRYFGESDGAFTTVGAREVGDLLAALDYLKGRGFEQIGVWGFSLGGAVALMASARTPLIGAIVSESSYARLSLMAEESYRYLFLLKRPLAFLTGIWSRLLLGVNPDEVSPEDAVANSRVPILLIHSTHDEVIPFSHAQRLRRALSGNPNAEFWFREGLVHGQLGDEYRERVGGFFRKHLAAGGSIGD